MKIKTPLEPQTFNDGICMIYAVTNGAENGQKPTKKLSKKYGRVPYERRRVGIQRIEVAKQQDVKVTDLIRVPVQPSISTGDVAVIRDIQYDIRMIQHIPDSLPPSMDLTLERITRKYDIEEAGKGI